MGSAGADAMDTFYDSGSWQNRPNAGGRVSGIFERASIIIRTTAPCFTLSV